MMPKRVDSGFGARGLENRSGTSQWQQFTGDIYRHHIEGRFRGNDPIGSAGAVVMPVVVGISNGIGAAFRGITSDEPAVPLGDGPLKYTAQGAKMFLDDAMATVKSAVTLRPIQFVKNAANTAFGALDLVQRPVVDGLSDVFGHISPQSRYALHQTLQR